MSVLIIETDDSDFWPCPEGCGNGTDDDAGGPCSACWREIDRRQRDGQEDTS